MKRFTDTEIWEEDWFLDLTSDHKLFYLYIKDKCDASGIWRPNKRFFQLQVMGGKMLFMDEFLNAVNVDENGEFKPRIIKLDNGNWFIPKFFSFQYGKTFNLANPAQRGALRILINNKIDLKLIPSVDFSSIEGIDFQTFAIKDLKGPYKELVRSLEGGKDKDKDKDKEQDKDNVEKIEKGIAENLNLTFVGNEEKNQNNSSFGKFYQYKKSELMKKPPAIEFFKDSSDMIYKKFSIRFDRDAMLVHWEDFVFRIFSESKTYNHEDDLKNHFNNWLNNECEKRKRNSPEKTFKDPKEINPNLKIKL